MDEKPISTGMSLAILATLLSVVVVAVIVLKAAQPLISLTS
ncbi:hypothetical protein [Mesorhizobium sp. 1M-11]|nr:hypothetical protein [Mesorhizobium sp. 1M-11]